MSVATLKICERCARHISKTDILAQYGVIKLLSPHMKISSAVLSQPMINHNCLKTPSLLTVHNNNMDNKIHFLNSQVRNYRFSWLSGETGMSKAVSEAEKIVGFPTSFLSLRCLFSDELSNVALQMRKLVGTKHPLLKTARGLVFDGKHNLQLRGLVIMLISKAAGTNPEMELGDQEMISGVYSSQRSLAEITEVIHTANLIHKGVVNLTDVKPEDGPISDLEFGNKMAVLSGDYLLASACTGLAKLENPQVLEKIATSIGDMMTSEFTNFSDSNGTPTIPDDCKGFADWLNQTFLSVGSLIARSCQSAMILGGHSDTYRSMAFSYGENMTYAQQLCTDLLPFLRRDELSGLTLASAPVYMFKEKASSDDFSQLIKLFEAGPKNYGKVVAMLTASGVVEHCQNLCRVYRDKAISSLACYEDSEAKEALINMATVVSDIR